LRSVAWCAAWTAAGVAACLVAHADDGGLTEDDRALVAWFDSLDFPALEGDRFGQVVQEWTRPTDGEKAERGRSVTAWGFLVREDEAAFVVRTTALEERSYERSVQGATRVVTTFEPHDLLGELRRAADVPGRHGFEAPFATNALFSGADDVGTCSLWVVGASIAARRGEAGLAHRLLERGRAEAEQRRDERTPPGLRDEVAADLAQTSIWRAKLALDRPDTKREDLLATFRRVAEKFPGTEHGDEAARYAKVLARMVAEDREHAKTARPFESLSPAEQVEELVFQLRDQDGGQFMQPGAPTVFTDRRGKDSPAERLVALGAAAVPALLAHFEDDGFTRTIGFWRDFHYSHYAVTVGEACADIVSRIANRQFGVGWNERWNADRARKARAEAEAWWVEFREGGESATNLSALRAGGGDARVALRRLCEIDPKLAVREGLPAIERAKGRDRHGLLQEITKLASDPTVEAFLVRTAETDSDRSCRVYAAVTLLHEGQERAIELALALWRAPSPRGRSDTSWDDEILARALLEFGGADGGNVVLDWFGTAGPESRKWFLEIGTRWKPVVPKDPATRVRLADLLAPLLDDTTDTGAMWTSHDRSGRERIADLAATWIAPLLADGAKFGARDLEADRDVAIARLRDDWRRARGLGPLPPAPDLFPAVAPEDPAVTGALVARAAAGDDVAAAELERLGLAALAAVRMRAESEPDDAARARLRAVESRLVRIVRSVAIDPKDRAPAALVAALDAAVGQVFDGDRLVALARAVVPACADGAVLPELRVERPRGADGLVVRVSFLRADPPTSGLALQMSRSVDGTRDTYSYGSDRAGELIDEQVASLRDFWAPCESARREHRLEFRVRFVR
jgi:hypothetical protein